MALPALDEDAPLVTPQKTGFDVVQAYAALLERDDVRRLGRPRRNFTRQC